MRETEINKIYYLKINKIFSIENVSSTQRAWDAIIAGTIIRIALFVVCIVSNEVSKYCFVPYFKAIAQVIFHPAIMLGDFR